MLRRLIQGYTCTYWGVVIARRHWTVQHLKKIPAAHPGVITCAPTGASLLREATWRSLDAGDREGYCAVSSGVLSRAKSCTGGVSMGYNRFIWALLLRKDTAYHMNYMLNMFH